ncbi:MAG: hypothetical protein AAFW89_08185 [Bacteroidota bacterium]
MGTSIVQVRSLPTGQAGFLNAFEGGPSERGDILAKNVLPMI